MAQPGFPIDPLIDSVLRRRPTIARRLSALGDCRVVIDPEELPGVLLLELRGGRITGRIVLSVPPGEVDASVCAPLGLLLDLVEGRVDGDAAFFGRALRIQGRTDVVVALRNALEDAELALADAVLAPLGPAAPVARRLCRGAAVLAARVARDLDWLERSIAAPGARTARAVAGLLASLSAEETPLPAPGDSR